MMDDLILHDATRAQLERFSANPSHALLLTGPDGVGKTAVAEALTTAVLGVQLASHPYYLVIRPDGASISIEAARNLQKFLLLKTTGAEQYRRAVLIEHSHVMTTEAQNAFLKLLEEPPSDTLIILTATSPRLLLPTILSRTQHIAINTPNQDQLKPLFDKSQRSAEATNQAYFLSGGLPGLLAALLSDGEEHPLATNINLAKELLQKQPFERFAMVDGLAKQKDTALGVAEALERIAQAGLNGAGAKRDVARINQWQKIRKASLQAQSALQKSANAKLTLDCLVLALP